MRIKKPRIGGAFCCLCGVPQNSESGRASIRLPMKSRNPNYEAVGAADILICHGPVMGYADGGKGCAELLRLAKRLRPRLVVSGHIHAAHGVSEGAGVLRGTTFVNAANAGKSHSQMAWEPVVVDI